MPDDKGARDPKALRALAHPLRWQLLDLLGSEETATATRCAEVLGESVASCSYHLGMLAKYGYIEEVPGRTGREKPWRLASTRQDLGLAGLDTEAVAELLGKTPGNIRVMAHRGLKKLEDLLGRAGVTSRAGVTL